MNTINLKNFKMIIGLLEIFLGLPIVGGLLIIRLHYIPLAVLLVLHILGLIESKKRNTNYLGHTIGIVGNVIAVIPIVGMIMHLITGVVNIVESSKIC